MHIAQIVIENYGSFYGKHVLDLREGITIISGNNKDSRTANSNGSGKSTVFEAADWCIFGVVPKDDSVDSIIPHKESDALVIVRLLDGEDTIVIERSRHRTKKSGKTVLKVWKNNDALTALDVSQTQQIINQLIGLDRRIFHAAVFFGQNDTWSFAQARESERLDLLLKILDLELLDELADVAKKHAGEYKTRLDTAVQRKQQAETAIGDLRAMAMELDTSIVTWQQNQQKTIADIMNRVQPITERMHVLWQTVLQHEETVRANHSMAQQQFALTPPIEYDNSPLQQAVHEADTAHIQWNKTLAVSANEVRRLAKEIKHMDNLMQSGHSVCSQCKQPISLSVAQHEKQRLMALQAEEQKKLTEADAALNGWAQKKRELEQQHSNHLAAHAQAYQEQMTVMQEANAQLQEVIRAKTEYDRLTQDRNFLIQDVEKRKLEQNPWIAQKTAMAADIVKRDNELALLEQEIKTMRIDVDHYEFWKQGLGNKGLKSYILDSKLAEMNAHVNEWLELLTGGDIWVQFLTQTITKANKVKNELTIRVYIRDASGLVIDQNFNSWSGGEKKRIGWAIDFGLSRMLAGRAQKVWKTLVLDEVFKHVDERGGQAVMDMLRVLRVEKDYIAVIEHNPVFKDDFDHNLEVTKKQGKSTFIWR
jgi:DNA repair exonuclease SbcCD ATPase subunit